MRLFSPLAALSSSLALFGLLTVPAAAQETLIGCQSQQSLEQVISSDSRLTPDDCRALKVTRVTKGPDGVCVVDLSTAQDGVLQQLRDVAMPEQWWVRCDALAATVR